MELATSTPKKSMRTDARQSNYESSVVVPFRRDAAPAPATDSANTQHAVYAHSQAVRSLEEILSECLRIQTSAELDWFATWRCLPWLQADCMLTGFAEFDQQECDVKAFKQFNVQQGNCHTLTRADTEHLVRVFVRKWRTERKPVEISTDSYAAHTVFASTFERFFPNAQTLVFNAHKDMCSPALSFTLINQGAQTDPKVHERLCLLMPHLQAALVRVMKNERRDRHTPSVTEMTVRERELLRSIARGHTDEEIAQNTQRSIHTIKNQVRQILMHYGFVNRVQAVAAGFAASIFWPDSIAENEQAQKKLR